MARARKRKSSGAKRKTAKRGARGGSRSMAAGKKTAARRGKRTSSRKGGRSKKSRLSKLLSSLPLVS